MILCVGQKTAVELIYPLTDCCQINAHDDDMSATDKHRNDNGHKEGGRMEQDARTHCADCYAVSQGGLI